MPVITIWRCFPLLRRRVASPFPEGQIDKHQQGIGIIVSTNACR